MIETDGLTKHYGDFAALEGLDLRVERGEVFGFLGPNGAGKTTTIRLLMGILVPTSGRATIDGLDCHRDRVELKRRTGYLPDSPTFHDYLRGHEILEFVARMHGFSRSEARRRTDELFYELSLADAAEEYAVNYSMGMKSKLGLACAFVHQPDLLILDEPTNGLDPRAASEVRERLRERAREGTTVFLSTHLLDMAERLCTRVGIIERGRLIAEGPIDELRRQFVPGGSLEHVYLEATREGSGAPGTPRPEGSAATGSPAEEPSLGGEDATPAGT